MALGLTLSPWAFASGAASSGVQTGAPPAMTLEEGVALARARACLGCHQVDKKRVGPSFKAVAQRFADKEGAVPYLAKVIRQGGRGQWGAIPMPGQAVNEQDAEKLAQWIITLRN
jgi:cytochrome c